MLCEGEKEEKVTFDNLRRCTSCWNMWSKINIFYVLREIYRYRDRLYLNRKPVVLADKGWGGSVHRIDVTICWVVTETWSPVYQDQVYLVLLNQPACPAQHSAHGGRLFPGYIFTPHVMWGPMRAHEDDVVRRAVKKMSIMFKGMTTINLPRFLFFFDVSCALFSPFMLVLCWSTILHPALFSISFSSSYILFLLPHIFHLCLHILCRSYATITPFFSYVLISSVYHIILLICSDV